MRYFRQQNGKWVFLNPLTGKNMEITTVTNDKTIDIFFDVPSETFTKVVFGNVLGCRMISDMMRMIGGKMPDTDHPIDKVKHFGFGSIPSMFKMFKMADKCLIEEFGEDGNRHQDRNITPNITGHVQLEFE